MDCGRALNELGLLAVRSVDMVDRDVAQLGEVEMIFGAEDVVSDEVLPRVGGRRRCNRWCAQQLINVGEVDLFNNYSQRDGCKISTFYKLPQFHIH